MHELSVAQALVELASEHARRAGTDHVMRLNCRVGLLRQIDADLMQTAFEMAREGTTCSEAELCIETAPVQLSCPQCGQSSSAACWNWTCKMCGADCTPTSGGEEMELVSIEVENPT